jgi:hypothetical protein
MKAFCTAGCSSANPPAAPTQSGVRCPNFDVCGGTLVPAPR